MTNKIDLYQKLILKYGKETQIIVAIEELAELQKELTKWLRGIGSIEHIAEEIVDVEIMCEQLEFMFACINEIIDTRFRKLERIEKLVELDENDTRDE
jgi:hypothetical protein